MKHLLRSFALLFLLASALTQAQKTYSFESVPGDPLEARIYTLENGLQVYLSRNIDAPRVQTNIATRAGSKNDPADATGLAHYLEHMLFKGTSHIGTADWAKESAVLQQISDAYEQRRKTNDEAERDRIYHRIDSLSTVAASFCVPNEYAAMTKSIGARGTNAYTSTERTVYINDIPSDELEKWMRIESERFQECVLRLFHTELETVYEEFNRGQDNDGRTAYAKKNALLYPNHPYGTQTTIGTGEHLKNPSMVKIQEYFKAWYVPNNMAVILAGDIDYDRTIALVDRYFGGWKRKEVPSFSFKPEVPIAAPVAAEVFGPAAEWVDLAWRFDGYSKEDGLMLQLIDGILNNGKAGILDLNLIQAQKVLDAHSSAGVQTDYSAFEMHGEPKQGQTLDQVRDLLLDQLEALKRGEFDDWLIEAVVDNKRQEQIPFWNENNGLRTAAMTDAFILRKPWKDVVGQYDRMAAITKPQVIDFAKKNFGSNYVCIYKRTGENKEAYKVTKPSITAIDIKRDGKSAWRVEWEKMPSAAMVPEFVEYSKAIDQQSLQHSIPLACVKNPTNDLFSLRYILDMGTNHDRALKVAVEYLPYLGTSKLSPVDLKKELFKLGLSLEVFASEDRAYVTLSGLEKNLERGVDLLEQVLADARKNDEALKGFVADIRKNRQDQLKNKNALLGGALFSQARYGALSPFNDVLSNDELAALDGAALVQRIHDLMSYPHKVFYYGRKAPSEVAALLNAKHKTPAAPKAIPAPKVYPELPTTANKVLFAEYDMVQTEMILASKAGPFDVEKLPYASLFNEYFGSGLNSIVFQEIREEKALAYGANASYTSPAKKEDAHYVRAFIGTQADKLNDAVAAMLVLMNDMPMASAQFEGAKTSALKVIASTRITKENIYWTWDAAQRRGLDYDVRKTSYERIPAITIEDMKAFFDEEIKGRPYTFCVIGKEAGMDLNVLEDLGPLKKLTKKDLFGYDEETP
ncbi:MAG: insulinase family protein [Flavobacteriales bacterium]|nr:insulinase family protein [Flavobacteriales bacterium]